MIGLGVARNSCLQLRFTPVATFCFAFLLFAARCSSGKPVEDTVGSQSTSPTASHTDSQPASVSDDVAPQLSSDNQNRANSVSVQPSSPSLASDNSHSHTPTEESPPDANAPSAPKISAEQTLRKLREKISFTAFLDDMDYNPAFNKELFRAGGFTDAQLALIKKAHKQHIRLGAERLILIDELYPDNPERYRTDDNPQNKAQFAAIDQKVADLGLQTNQRLWQELSDEQRCRLLAFSHGADAIFHPTVQKAAGISDKQLLETAVNVVPHWKALKEYRSQQDEEADFREAIAAVENFKKTGTLLDRRDFVDRMHRLEQLEQAANDSHWLLFDERQLTALRKLGLKNAFKLGDPELLAPHEMRADIVNVRFYLLPDARRELKLSDRFVFIRGLVRYAAQQRKFAKSSPADGTIEVSGDLWNFDVQRQARAIGTDRWEDWHPFPLARTMEVLKHTEFALDPTPESLRDSSVTMPFPYLESGSWESVTGHPKATADSGEVILRLLDLDTKPGNEYRYRARVKWRVGAVYSRPKVKEAPQQERKSAAIGSPVASPLDGDNPYAGFPGEGLDGTALGNSRTRLPEQRMDTPFSEPTPAIAIRK